MSTKIIKPDEALELSSEDSCVKEVVAFVNLAISSRQFHYNSDYVLEGKKYFRVNVFRFLHFGEKVFDKVVEMLIESGYEAHHATDYCGHGPFHSIRLRTDSFNPEKITYDKIPK